MIEPFALYAGRLFCYDGSMDAGRPERMTGTMAKLIRTIDGVSFDALLKKIEQGVVNSSMSATMEDSSDFSEGNARCSVRVFERYSYMGSNRVSLNVTLFQAADGPIRLTAITSGGSQAMFFKLNTIGEEAFLDKLRELL